MEYTPKSKFILNEIRKRSFKNKEDRKYIEDLILLEQGVMGGIASIGWARYIDDLTQKYKKEYSKLLKELDPKKLEREMKEKKKEERENKRIDKQLKEEDKREKEQFNKFWVDAGGKN